MMMITACGRLGLVASWIQVRNSGHAVVINIGSADTPNSGLGNRLAYYCSLHVIMGEGHTGIFVYCLRVFLAWFAKRECACEMPSESLKTVNAVGVREHGPGVGHVLSTSTVLAAHSFFRVEVVCLLSKKK